MGNGFVATLAITGGWVLFGIIVGMVVLALLWGWKPARSISFPLLDELTGAQDVWARDVKRKQLSVPDAIRLAGLAIAFGLVTGSTISATLDLIGRLATPAG